MTQQTIGRQCCFVVQLAIAALIAQVELHTLLWIHVYTCKCETLKFSTHLASYTHFCTPHTVLQVCTHDPPEMSYAEMHVMSSYFATPHYICG